MRRAAFFVLILISSVFVAVELDQAQEQNRYYLFDGKTLEVADSSLVSARSTPIQWQVWFYQEGVHIPEYTSGLQYSRWGVITGSSPKDVMRELRDYQSFEQAYLKFFGSDTWDRYGFLNPVGPIGVNDQAPENDSGAVEKQFQLHSLQDRANKLVNTVRPSLENNDNQGSASSVEGFFDQVRDVLERVSRMNSQLFHDQPQLRYIETGIVRAQTELAQAEGNAVKIISVLPTVKLPASKAWMSHTEKGGSEGTIQVEVREIGNGVSVDQTWSGGDGSMAGTNTITTIPFKDIGKIDLRPPAWSGDDRWTVHIESSGVPFPETLESPLRTTSRASYPAVHSVSAKNWFFLDFTTPADAQDAYNYFLYHKQRGR
jgi:hypothetical protein